MPFHDDDGSNSTLSDINVTPLVDVMLVLLVIFIVTAPLLTNAIPVNLPKTDATGNPPAPTAPLVINVDRQGAIQLGNQNVSLDQLPQKLSAAAEGGKEPHVQLQADKDVNYGVVANVMAIAERAGVTHLSVMTER